jgi:hypothetical protein
MGPRRDVDLNDIGSRNNTYLSNTLQGSNSHYKQVHIGYGRRSDFTLENVKAKADFNYDYESMGTIRNTIEKQKKAGTNKDHTFGTPWQGHGKSVVRGAPHFSRVDECKTQLITLDALNSANNQTLKNHVRLPKMSTDRGLQSPTKNQRESLQRGPGTHEATQALAFKPSERRA